MEFLRDVDKGKMCEAWDEALKNNTPDAGAELKAEFATLCEWMEDIAKGEQFAFTYVPGTGTTVMVRGPNAARSVTALSERPIRRWISCVRPRGPLRSRSVRVCVARGSIAYSAVTHPFPLAARQAGSSSDTLAVQSTRVFPVLTRQEPSAYGAASTRKESGRSAPGARPWLRVTGASRGVSGGLT